LQNAVERPKTNGPGDTAGQPSKRSRLLRLKLVGANAEPSAEGLDQLEGKINYLTSSDPSKWRTDIPTYRRVRYPEVYPGIDLVYYGNQRQLEYDFVVAPGADWRRVKLSFVGADSLKVDAATGELVVRVGDQTVRQHKPIIYQELPDGRREIEGRYVLLKGRRVGFEVGKYDPSLPLVIDPVFVYSTFLGGHELELNGGMAVDSAGNVYVTGETDSDDFPLKDPYQTTHRTPFVTKINAQGNALVYSTYFGLGSVDTEDIAVDSAGSVYLTGDTYSDGISVVNAVQGTFGGGERDAFVTKINPAGNGLVYSTYLGGAAVDEGMAIVVDDAGNAYLTGRTESLNFPTANPLQANNAGFEDVFITKINPSGNALVYSTYLGGEGVEFGNAIAVDPAGNTHICGTTYGGFPTVTAIQANRPGNDEAFVAKLSATGNSLLYSTYLGGSEDDYGYGIATDSSGNTYIVGETDSADFPITTNAFGKTYGGVGDGFITKINASGNAFVYSNYLGGNLSDRTRSVAVDSNGNAHLVGSTSSSDFPVVNPLQSTTDGKYDWADAFVSKVNPAGDALVYSTYLGGSYEDYGDDIAVDAAGNAYLSGLSNSFDFPTLNAAQPGYSGNFDVFITKISDSPGPPVVVKKLANVSTRLSVGTGENVLIGGFIITGSGPRRVAIRGIGPSLTRQGFSNPLTDPTLEIYRGNELIAANDNWQDSQQAEIEATRIAPTETAESMVIRTLEPGNYTAILRGKNDGTGIALVEVYDLLLGAIGSELANISTRGFVQTGSEVMIGGFIVRGGGASTEIVARALGPSLRAAGISAALADPILEVRDENGGLVAANDNWRQSQQAEIESMQLAPGNDLESALIVTLRTGDYTAIVRGKDNSTGVGLVEVYNVH
jgi:hypothetical protein